MKHVLPTLLALAGFASCTPTRSIARLPELSEEEVMQTSQQLYNYADIILTPALAEGKIDPVDAQEFLYTLRMVSEGNVYGSVQEAFDATTVEGAVLRLLALEVDMFLRDRGGFDSDNKLTTNARLLVGDLAQRLEALVTQYVSN